MSSRRMSCRHSLNHTHTHTHTSRERISQRHTLNPNKEMFSTGIFEWKETLKEQRKRKDAQRNFWALNQTTNLEY